METSEIKTGISIIAEERARQIEKEGYTTEHDTRYTEGDLANAASCYAMTPYKRSYIRYIYNYANGSEPDKDKDMPAFWPWDKSYWKPSPNNRIRELAKAGALIAAEIDRLLKIEQ